MNKSRCTACGIDLVFALTRPRVLDVMKSRGYPAAGCHPDGTASNSQNPVDTGILPGETITEPSREEGEHSPWKY